MQTPSRTIEQIATHFIRTLRYERQASSRVRALASKAGVGPTCRSTRTPEMPVLFVVDGSRAPFSWTLGVAIVIPHSMEPQPNRLCPHCGVRALPDAAFCHTCGRQLAEFEQADPTNKRVREQEELEVAPEAQQSLQPTFRGLRALNWIIVALLVSGAALMLLRSSQPTGVLLIASLMAFLVGTFLLTAVLLSRETVYFIGFPVGAYRSPLRKIALVCNVVMALFGVFGLIACIATQQFGPMVGMLIYAIPPILNVKALRTIVRFAS